MRILVVGGGGREHALCWKIAASPRCEKLFCAPGNAGIAAHAECLPLGAEDLDGLVDFALKESIDFVVVGPEAPLVAGLVDRLAEKGIAAFGPSASAARLEGSKGFMKDLCATYDIPTADYARFCDPSSAKAFVREQGAPLVIKADGLAAGKGVIIAETQAEAEAAIDQAMVEKSFGEAGQSLVIEEFLEGEEASFFALVDGKNALPLAGAQDHKQVYDGDKGPNTGGMGAYSPAPVLTSEMSARIMTEIIEPTVAAMAEQGHPYRGVLFAGLMITAEGPKLIEYNVRFGDPECQVVLARLESDLLPALLASARGDLGGIALEWSPENAVTVVLASAGYPGPYEKGSTIKGLENASQETGCFVFHAGTLLGPDGAVLANGGRVLNVTALGGDIRAACDKAYGCVDLIDWPQGFCRRDIGWRALAREAC